MAYKLPMGLREKKIHANTVKHQLGGVVWLLKKGTALKPLKNKDV